jgi:hypothetical protein
MSKNIQEVATENANEVENLKKENVELQFQLDVEKWLNQMYKSVLTEGKFEVTDEVQLYRCVYAIGMCCNLVGLEQATKYGIKDLNVFDNQEERGQKVYFTYDAKCGWYINYQNANGIVATMRPHQLILDSHEYNLLDAIDDLK